MVAASKVSAKKARANRRNARKSTGPKTPQGKAASSQNATSHGIYCRHVVLDGEDQQRFDLLRNAYIHSLRPQDELELSFVDRVVQDQWKLNRLQAAEQRLYDFRRREHQSLLERRRAGELGAPPLMEKRWERVDNVLDPMAEPDFTAFCSALGSTSVTMLSLLGDERCQLERYEKHRRHLHLNISRALRELRLLRQPLKKGQEPLPPSPFSNENFAAQGERLAAYMRQLDEEQAELDRLFGPRDQNDDDDDDDDDDMTMTTQRQTKPTRKNPTPINPMPTRLKLQRSTSTPVKLSQRTSRPTQIAKTNPPRPNPPQLQRRPSLATHQPSRLPSRSSIPRRKTICLTP